MRLLNINSIEYTLQGEGSQAGRAMILIRLSGCNENCDFCDTDYTRNFSMNVGALLEHIRHFPARYILWTGGEPTLSLNDEIIEYFNSNGYKQAIETNGTNPIPNGFDYITISPKKAIHYSIKKANELRQIILGADDRLPLNTYGVEFDHLYLSPAFDGLELRNDLLKHCIKLCKENPKWKLSIQQHKIWKIT